jgi:hypothetical protein
VSARAASVSPVLHALLDRVVDYAGLFPPAALSMHDAVAEYAAQRKSPDAWMLGRFVVPVTRLDELTNEAGPFSQAEQAPWCLSALVGTEPASDANLVRSFNATWRGRFAIDAVELRAASTEAIDSALPRFDGALERYVEIPLDDDPRPLLQAIRRHGGRAKARTGGVTRDAFPSTDALARFIVACADTDVPFKATAGLHHPLRGEQPLTYDDDAPRATMFGFIDLFAAAAFARAGATEREVALLLDERDASAFTFSEGTLQWRGRLLDASAVMSGRRNLAIAFGSCSFRDPVTDLHRLGLL